MIHSSRKKGINSELTSGFFTKGFQVSTITILIGKASLVARAADDIMRDRITSGMMMSIRCHAGNIKNQMKLEVSFRSTR